MANQPNERRVERLGPEEWKTLHLRLEGKTNAEIAALGNKSQNTVKNSVYNALTKMGYGEGEREWKNIAEEVRQRLVDEADQLRPLELINDQPTIEQTTSQAAQPSRDPTSQPITANDPPMRIRTTPSLLWLLVAGGVGFVVAALLGLASGLFNPQRGIVVATPTPGPSPAAVVERVAQTVLAPQTVIVTETVEVAASVVAQETVEVPVTVIVTATPEPVTAAPPTPAAATTAATTIEATLTGPTSAPANSSPTVEVTPTAGISLPFEDSFNTGRRPEWRVIYGNPLVKNQRLRGANFDIVILELDVRKLGDFTVRFDGYEIWEGVVIYLNESWRFVFKNGKEGVQVIGRIEELRGSNWVEVTSQDGILTDTQSGLIELKVVGDRFAVFGNGVNKWDFIQAGVGERGPLRIAIDERVAMTDIDNFSLTSP